MLPWMIILGGWTISSIGLTKLGNDSAWPWFAWLGGIGITFIAFAWCV